ncbi:hypothetical protein K3495_g12760 [Podosphaera aphanis]|nr:hypothetical protein K3495_g12760 [Podosphaera aphanis]
MRLLITAFTSALVFSTSVVCVNNKEESKPRLTKDASKDAFLREDDRSDVWTPVIQNEVMHDQALNDLSFSFNTFSADADADAGFSGNTDASIDPEVNANSGTEIETYSVLSIDEARTKFQKRTPFGITMKRPKPGYNCPKSLKYLSKKRRFISKVRVDRNLARACKRKASRKIWKKYPKKFSPTGIHLAPGTYYQWPLGYKAKRVDKKISRYRIVMDERCNLVGVFSRFKKCFVQCENAWK